jgi:surface polysaccharide O-acyltransferase-like enzyme
MTIKSDISTRIQVLRFPLILCVVFLHASWLTPYKSQPYLSGSFPEFFIAHTVSPIAVPFLFIISGYLFFINFYFSWEGYREKLKRRVFSLILPYLGWNITYFLLLSLKPLLENPSTGSQNHHLIIDYVWNFINAITGLKTFFPALYSTFRYNIEKCCNSQNRKCTFIPIRIRIFCFCYSRTYNDKYKNLGMEIHAKIKPIYAINFIF